MQSYEEIFRTKHAEGRITIKFCTLFGLGFNIFYLRPVFSVEKGTPKRGEN